MPNKIIYLDNAATTSVYPAVVKEMEKYMLSDFGEYGNPSSTHDLGEQAQKNVQKAKKIVASEIGCKPHEIIFTSSGTESNNLALQGVAKANPDKKKIIISSIEHSSIYELCMEMKKYGYEIFEISVDNKGFIDFDELQKQVDDRTLIVSIMHANNEIGVIQNIEKIGELCREKEVLFHTDAVQSFCKEKIDVFTMKVDMLSASGHKIGASKGVGFLYVGERVKIEPIIVGGNQENSLRAGTQNVPAIMGFAKAISIAEKVDKEKMIELRDYFISKLENIGGKINGSKEKRLCNNIDVSFSGADNDSMLIKLSENGIMCSTKSACASKQKKENRILSALGLKKEEIGGALRFSLNEFNTKKEIDIVVRELEKIVP